MFRLKERNERRENGFFVSFWQGLEGREKKKEERRRKTLTGSGVLEHPLRDADGVLGGASRDVLDVGLVGELLRRGLFFFKRRG